MNHKRKKISFQPDNYHTVMILIAMLNILLIDYMVSLNGSGYVGLSLFMFWVIASVCSLWFSSLTAKVIRQKISQSQNKSAKSFWKTALICNVFPNALLSLTFFIFSDPVCQFLFLNRNMSLCVKIIALSFIPFGLICLLSGYLKGIGLLNPVRLVLIIQQVLIFIFSVTGLWVVSEYGEKVSQLLNNVEIMAVYKATGALAGALLGIIIGILLLCVFILILHKNQKESFSNDQHKNYDSFRYEIQTVFRYGISHILFSLTVLLVPLIDFIFYIRSEKTSSDITEIMQLAGVLFSVVLPLIIILLTLWKKILFSFEYFMRNALKEQNFQLFKEYVFGILRGCMAVMLPVTILLVILSESVLKLLFGSAVQPDHITMFRVGSILVFFLSYLLVLLQIL